MDRQHFYDRVYAVVKQIPTGRVTTYGHIARFLGSARSSRMVGYALNASIGQQNIPAHRVVNRQGLLTGKHYFGGSTLMEDLLGSEGVEVAEDKVVNFSELLWDPAEHLKPTEFLP